MTTDSEIKRICRVYGTYQHSQAIQAQWNADNPGNRAILEERFRKIVDTLDVGNLLPLASRKILDVGCGAGHVLSHMLHLGAQSHNLYGLDLLPARIAEAQRVYPDLSFQCANAEEIEFPDRSFDLVLLFTVISSILDEEMACNIAAEATRVLKPGGAVLWYDFRYDNPRNPNVRGITRRDIIHLFPAFQLDLRTTTLLPLIARRLGRATRALYPLLAAIPPLRTHYLGLLVKTSKHDG